MNLIPFLLISIVSIFFSCSTVENKNNINNSVLETAVDNNNTNFTTNRRKSFYVSQGIDFLDADDTLTAIRCFTEAIRENENDADAYFYRGNTYFDLGQYNNAINDYNKLLRLNTIEYYQIIPTWINRGKAYRLIGNYNEALNNFTRVIIDATQNSRLSDAWELDDSKELFDSMIEAAYSNRALTYIAMENYNNAISDYNNAIKMNQNNAEYFSNRGNCYMYTNNLQKAISDYLEAINIDTEFSAAYYGMAQCYFMMKNYSNAIVYFTKAIDINTNDAESYLRRGFSYAMENDFQKAVSDVQMAVRLEPENNRYREMLQIVINERNRLGL